MSDRLITSQNSTATRKLNCYCCTCQHEDGAIVRWDPACRNHGAHGLRGCAKHGSESANCDCGCGYKVSA